MNIIPVSWRKVKRRVFTLRNRFVGRTVLGAPPGGTSPDVGGQPRAVAAPLGRFLLLLPKESVPDPERKSALVLLGTQGRLVSRAGAIVRVVIPKLLFSSLIAGRGFASRPLTG